MQVEPTKTETKMGAGGKFWKAMLASGAGLAALAALNSTVPRRRLELPTGNANDTENGEALFYEWKCGEVFYRVAGSTDKPPLVFIHDIAPGVSSFMWWRNFGRLAADFRVYAIDLLGFGASSKPPTVPYSTDFYVTQISDFIQDVVGTKAHLVGSGLGAAFATRVAIEDPRSVERLTLIAPPGLSEERDARAGMRGAAFYSLLNSPVLGTSFYNTLASERALRDYARRQLFFNKRLATKGLVAHLYAQSHQHGAQHAVTAYLSGYVAANVRTPLAAVSVPTTVVLDASSDDLTQPGDLRDINPHLTVEIFDNSRLWLHAEHPDRFNDLVVRVMNDE